MVYKVLWHKMQSIKPGTPGRTPSVYDKCNRLVYINYTIHGTYSFTSHSKDAAVMVKCLA